MPLPDCLSTLASKGNAPLVTLTAYSRLCAKYITSALFYLSAGDCLSIHRPIQYTQGSRLTLFVHNQRQRSRVRQEAREERTRQPTSRVTNRRGTSRGVHEHDRTGDGRVQVPHQPELRRARVSDHRKTFRRANKVKRGRAERLAVAQRARGFLRTPGAKIRQGPPRAKHKARSRNRPRVVTAAPC
jgi:hypothetical protein